MSHALYRRGPSRPFGPRHAAYLATRPDLLADLPTLRGQTLACWCAPLACHAEVLAAQAEATP